jgi:DNA ligase-1
VVDVDRTQSLLVETFRVRRSTLHAHFPPIDPDDLATARFGHVNSLEAKNSTEDMDAVASFMAEATGNKCEGLMIKILDHELVPAVTPIVKQEGSEGEEPVQDEVVEEVAGKKTKKSPKKGSRRKLLLSSYEPDKSVPHQKRSTLRRCHRRADSWMKVKKDYSETGGDSFDLVPIAAWHGQGRKVGWWCAFGLYLIANRPTSGRSPILLAVYDPDRDVFSAVCKCISGFTDREWLLRPTEFVLIKL